MRKNLTQSTQFPIAIITLTNETGNVYASITFVDTHMKTTHRATLWSDDVTINNEYDMLHFFNGGQMIASFEQASRYTIVDNRKEV